MEFPCSFTAVRYLHFWPTVKQANHLKHSGAGAIHCHWHCHGSADRHPRKARENTGNTGKHWIYSDETCGKPWKPPEDPPSKLTKCVWPTLVAMTALHLSDGRSRVEHCTWVIFYCDTRTLCSKLNASSTITVQCEMCIAPGSVHQSTSSPDQQFSSHLWQAIKMRCIYVAGKKKLVKHCGFNWGGSSSSRVAQKWVCVFTHSCHTHWQFQFATPVYKTVFFH